jgi:hypothetical protein
MKRTCTALGWTVLAVLLAWVALATLGSVDIDATAELFSAAAGAVGGLMHHV